MNNNLCCENRITYPTNCKNCGAPLHGSRCEYCGTKYNLVSGLEAKLNELKFRTANTQQIANIKFGTPIGYKTNSEIMAIKDRVTRQQAIAEKFGLYGIYNDDYIV